MCVCDMAERTVEKAIVIHTKQREVRVLETEALLQFLMHLVGVLSIRDLESELHRG